MGKTYSIPELEKELQEANREARDLCTRMDTYTHTMTEELNRFIALNMLEDKVSIRTHPVEFSYYTPNITYCLISGYKAEDPQDQERLENMDLFDEQGRRWLGNFFRRYFSGLAELLVLEQRILDRQETAYSRLERAYISSEERTPIPPGLIIEPDDIPEIEYVQEPELSRKEMEEYFSPQQRPQKGRLPLATAGTRTFRWKLTTAEIILVRLVERMARPRDQEGGNN